MNRTTFAAKLNELQRRQYQHDEAAHSDLLNLLLPKRLTHFTLHFAKYQGRLVHAFSADDHRLCQRVLTDSLIITLAAANGMNLSLQHHFPVTQALVGFAKSSRCVEDARGALLLEYIEIVGNMAKACEALDHIENFPSRTVLEQSTISLLDVIFRLAQIEQLDLLQAVAQRWKEIEDKFVLTRCDGGKLGPKQNSISAVA